MKEFDFSLWNREAYGRGEIWANSSAVRRVTQHIGETGEQPTAAFACMWNTNKKSTAALEDSGIVVLFPDRFWLIPGTNTDVAPGGFREIPWSGINSVSDIPDGDDLEHFHDIALNRGNIKITLVQPSEKADALKAFQRHIFA